MQSYYLNFNIKNDDIALHFDDKKPFKQASAVQTLNAFSEATFKDQKQVELVQKAAHLVFERYQKKYNPIVRFILRLISWKYRSICIQVESAYKRVLNKKPTVETEENRLIAEFFQHRNKTLKLAFHIKKKVAAGARWKDKDIIQLLNEFFTHSYEEFKLCFTQAAQIAKLRNIPIQEIFTSQFDGTDISYPYSFSLFYDSFIEMYHIVRANAQLKETKNGSIFKLQNMYLPKRNSNTTENEISKFFEEGTYEFQWRRQFNEIVDFAKQFHNFDLICVNDNRIGGWLKNDYSRDKFSKGEIFPDTQPSISIPGGIAFTYFA